MKIRFYLNDDKRWFAGLGWWPFKKKHLEMVAGSADFLDYLTEGYNRVNYVTIRYRINNEKLNLPNQYECKKVSSELTKGAFYKVTSGEFKTKLYLCPVALFVFGHYPEYIYIDKDIFVFRSGARSFNNIS